MNSELLNAVSKAVRGSNIIILPGYGKPKIESEYYPKRIDIGPSTPEHTRRIMRAIHGLEVTE